MPAIVIPVWPWHVAAAARSRHFTLTSDGGLVGGLNPNPVGFTLQEFVRIAYGVKRFKLRILVHYDAFGSPHPASPFNLTTYLPVGSASTASPQTGGFTSETNLVVYDGSTARWLPVGGNPISSIIFYDSAQARINYLYSGNGLYYPFAVFNKGTSESITVTWGVHQGGYVAYQTFTTGVFCGKAISYEIGRNSGITIVSSLVEFGPSPDGGGYWPYDPGDGGGPVWHTDTGAQLRNPFAL